MIEEPTCRRITSRPPGDLDDMRHGKTATVRTGPYAGEILSVDHIIPRTVAPELDNVIANMELMPLSVNQKKGDKIGDRQVSLAKAFHDAGLLSDTGLWRRGNDRRVCLRFAPAVSRGPNCELSGTRGRRSCCRG